MILNCKIRTGMIKNKAFTLQIRNWRLHTLNDPSHSVSYTVGKELKSFAS